MLVSSIVRELCSTYVSPCLKKAGFRKYHVTWNRRFGAIVHVVQLTVSRWSTEHEIRMTLDIGVLIEDVNRIAWGRTPSRRVSESDCFPSFRYSARPGSETDLDQWWELSGANSIQSVGPEIKRALECDCIPLLDECWSVEAILKLAESVKQRPWPAEQLARAVLRCLAGNEAAGMQLFDELESDPKLKAWWPKIREARSRLNAAQT